MSKMGYWIDLNGVQLSDDRKIWMQAFPYGTYKHPLYGVIKSTYEKASRFAANVKNKVRGTDLDIDYDHKEYSGKAAGWIQDAEARGDGLWIQVEFTEDAFNSIGKKEYRYFSPEFVDKWKNPATGEIHQDVLFGGALTNRPFLKDILPINMSETTGAQQVDEILKQLREKLGLGEEAGEEDVLKALEELEVTPEGENEEDDTEDDSDDNDDSDDSEDDTEDDSTELAELIESNPKIKKLYDRVEMLSTAARLSEVDRQLDRWDSSDEEYSLPPAVRSELRSVMSLSDNKTRKSLTKIFDALCEKGMVKLSETGGGERHPRRVSGGGSATADFHDRAVKLSEEKKITYREAALELSSDDPDLFDQHLDEVMEGV